ncbi:MAG: hypothetical protein IJ471_06710 [Eubacterium sp.]|nr:hypothetical protein [Eubacterium sp.]
MTGLEKIIEQILMDAQTKAQENISQAKAQADSILAEARLQAQNQAESIRKKSALDMENYKKSAASANDLYRRTEVLKAKQEVISQIIRAAYENVCNREPDSYFAMLETLLGKNVQALDGILYLSEKDLMRMPEGFADRVSEIAKSVGGTLTVSPTGKAIENGFVLVYGGVEDNCSIKALFDAKRDEMQDVVNEILYRREA